MYLLTRIQLARRRVTELTDIIEWVCDEAQWSITTLKK